MAFGDPEELRASPCGFATQRWERFGRFTLHPYDTLRDPAYAPPFYHDNHGGRSPIERDSAMGRVSMPSRASAILVATAATLGAMTAYNVISRTEN